MGRDGSGGSGSTCGHKWVETGVGGIGARVGINDMRRNKLFFAFGYVLCVICYLLCVTCYVLCVKCHVTYVMCQVTHVVCIL